jgi:hypothetical protein
MLSWKYDGYETWRRGKYTIYLVGEDGPIGYAFLLCRQLPLCLGQFHTLTDAMSYGERAP